MTENDAGRRPSGPPPSWLGAGLPTAPIPSGAAEQNEPPEEVRPAGGARGTMGRVGNVIGALVAVTALVAIVFVFGRPYVAQWFGGGGESSSALGEGEDNVYDFTQTVSTESPLGPLPEVTIRVPDGLANAVPGYADGRYLDAVTVSNVQYAGRNDAGGYQSFFADSLCSIDLIFDWHEGVLERKLADSAVGDYETVLDLAGIHPDSFRELEFSSSDDWSRASATVGCHAPADFSTTGGGIGMSIAFGYDTSNGADGIEARTLASAPLVFTDNGKLFVAEGVGPNVEGWEFAGEGQWVEAYGQ